MKEEVILRSIKQGTRATWVLAIICIGLIWSNIVQNLQYSKAISQQTEKYTELALTQQPDISEFPNRKLGKFSITWYSPKELGKSINKLRTSTGVAPKEGRTVAVDPKVIPYGSILYIQGYGYYIAEDCGGVIKENRIDIYTTSHRYAMQQGRKVANIWVLGKI